MCDKVSIVTVSYQSENCIRDTISSVLQQTYRPLEYIVIDGGSTDETVKILATYEKEFQDHEIEYAYISEPDNGIYDAMNKALNYCTGEWVIYLGTDDVFTSENIIETIFSVRYPKETGVLYGNVILESDGIWHYRKADDIDALQYKMAFSHQAVLTRRNLLLSYPFDSNHKVSGEMYVYMRLYEAAVLFVYVDLYIAVFHVGGVSFHDKKMFQKEYKNATAKIHTTAINRIKRIIYCYLTIPVKYNRTMYKLRLLFLKHIKKKLN